MTRLNFLLALVISLILGVCLLFSLDPQPYFETPLGYKGLVGATLFVPFQIGMWFRYYRNDEGYVPAAATGVALSAPAIASLFIPQITGQHLAAQVVLLSLYLSLSNLAYALANWAKSRRTWLDP